MFLPSLRREITFNSNSYLEAYYWKVLLTRKVVTLRKGFHDITVQNGGFSKVIYCRT